MLLVDDHEPEPIEGHAVFEERVRPDDDHRPAGSQSAEQDVALSGIGACGEAIDFDAGRTKHPTQRQSMLLSQDLGRRHQHGLITAVDARDDRRNRHDGLPRPHIALEQPVHRRRLAHIMQDSVDGALLRTGEGEWQRLQKPGQQIARRTVRRLARHRLHVTALLQDADLEHEEFLKRQPSPGALLLGLVLRKVRAPQRLPQPGQTVPPAHCVRQGIRDRVRIALQRLAHDRP